MGSSLSKTQQKLLLAIISGATLKSHRYINGRKQYKLHPLDETIPPTTIRSSTVSALKEKSLIASNQKFPAATFLLTEEGRTIAKNLIDHPRMPLSASGW